MKIRIKDNSVRLRLTQGEVKTFEIERMVSAKVDFMNRTSLKYTLQWSMDTEFSAVYDNDEIKVTVPNHVGEKWLKPEEVGMEYYANMHAEEKLRILIEKDFACLTERKDEDESDNFPNPMSNC